MQIDETDPTSGFTAMAVSPNNVSGRVVAIVRKSLLQHGLAYKISEPLSRES